MKRSMTLLYFALLAGLLIPGSALLAQSKILVAGSGNNYLRILDKNSGRVEWSHPLEPGEECNTVTFTPDGEILYSYKKGARLITTGHRVVWDYKAPEGTEVQSATLAGGRRYLIGICGSPARFVELDRSGNTRHTVTLDLQIEKPHSQFRQVFRAKNGNYLVPVMAGRKLIELNKKGNIAAEYTVDGRLFSSLELKDGNLLLPCGDGHYYLVIDRKTGKEIKRVGTQDISGAGLLFVAQVQRLGNGNLLICNWHGHNKDQSVDEPQLIEVDPAGQVVWSLNDKENIGKVSAACYIPDARKLNY